MKKILVACPHSQIDAPLRKSLAHLTKSCKISIVHDGYSAFDEISAQAFNLIIIDSELPGIDSLEVVEGIQYIDPDVPVILILKQNYSGVWKAIRHFNAHPIIRPFKPLRFLRLVDNLLHQHLSQYRHLAERLKTILETLRDQTGAPCAFLVEDSGQILIASGDLAGISLELLGNLAAKFILAGETQELSEQVELFPVPQNHGLYLTFVTANLYLTLISTPVGQPQESAQIWRQVNLAVSQSRVALYDQLRIDMTPLSQSNHSPSRLFIPLKFSPDSKPSQEKDEVTDIPINWNLISNTTGLLSRLDNFCRIS